MAEVKVDDGSYVTGVGDEVVHAAVVTTTIILALSIALVVHRVTRTGEQLVHPQMVRQ